VAEVCENHLGLGPFEDSEEDMTQAGRYRSRADRWGALGVLATLLGGAGVADLALGGPAALQAQGPGPSQYGDTQTLPLEELLNGNAPLAGGVRTRGVLEAGPRVQGGRRRYALTLPRDSVALTVQRRLPITPGYQIRDSFDFDADMLNMREIEVVGTFQPGVASDTGTGTGFWFWAYYSAEDVEKPRHAPTGLLAIEDLVGRPASLAKETVRVRGQFRGNNLFGDLAAPGAPADAWVIKDGDSAVWVTGRRPKGDGWSLDPDSRGDTTRWIEVVGKIETKEGVTFLKASKVALVPAPKPGEADPE
jgi:hypothetical protein